MTAFAQKSILSFSTVIKMGDINFEELLKSSASTGKEPDRKVIQKSANEERFGKEDLKILLQKTIAEREKLADERRKFKYERAVQPGPQWLIGEQVMKMLSVSTRTLQNYRDAGILGYSSFGGKFYYLQTEFEILKKILLTKE